MIVTIKDFAVTMELGSKGVEFEIKNTQRKHLGDLRITMTHLEWCKGRTRRPQAKRITLERLIELMDEG
jgi:hypothetical protein